jgi:WD40 repeat protein
MQFSKHWAATLDDYVIDLAWSPDGSMLAAASAAGGITLYDAATGALRQALAGHEDGANVLAWMPSQSTDDRKQKTDVADESPSSVLRPLSSDLLATGGQDGFVRLWDATTGEKIAEAKLGSAWVEHLAWRPVQRTDDRERKTGPASKDPSSVLRPLTSALLFAAAGKKLFALKTDGSVAHTFPDAPKTISALAVGRVIPNAPGLAAYDERRIKDNPPYLAAAYFGGVGIWDTGTFSAQKELPYGNAILALAWSPDGRWLVAGCHDNAVHLWVPAEDLELHMSGYETKLKELSFSRDSKWLATGGGRDACVWDCTGNGPEGREPLLLPHKARVCAVAFQHEHSLLATAAADGEFCLWSPTRKNPLVAEVKMPAAATKFTWSPDDSLLAVGTEKGAVFVFKIED